MAVVSNVYPNDKNEPVGPFIKRGNAVSVQVEITSGTGAVGTYQLYVSNSGEVYVTQGSVINAAGITEVTVVKQYVKVVQVTPPDSGTVVKVTIYGDSPGE